MPGNNDIGSGRQVLIGGLALQLEHGAIINLDPSPQEWDYQNDIDDSLILHVLQSAVTARLWWLVPNMDVFQHTLAATLAISGLSAI